MRPYWGWVSVVLVSLIFSVSVDGKRCSNGPSASSLLFDISKSGGMKCQKCNEYKDFGDCTDTSDDDLEEEEEEGNEWRYDPDGFGFEEVVRI